jgi:hypothetical protein
VAAPALVQRTVVAVPVFCAANAVLAEGSDGSEAGDEAATAFIASFVCASEVLGVGVLGGFFLSQPLVVVASTAINKAQSRRFMQTSRSFPQPCPIRRNGAIGCR